jgi:hypothetical protein
LKEKLNQKIDFKNKTLYFKMGKWLLRFFASMQKTPPSLTSTHYQKNTKKIK